jgi:CHAT domain-containing protein
VSSDCRAVTRTHGRARVGCSCRWAVESDATMRLTTSTFDTLKPDPTLDRAEALRRAMLAYMTDATNPQNAYPALWAPFVVVGEGAAQSAIAAMR